ncbi:MAG TPA: hypothetical protein PKB12_05165 [Elusimicrobiota bacterium]|nr:hypothetical protein [Elusimicrobiota bacterium]
MAIDLSALKAELLADPAGLGLSVASDDEAATLLNAVPSVNTEAFRRVVRNTVLTYEIMGAITRAEFNGLTANDKNYVQALCSCGVVDPSSSNIVSAFVAMFSGQSQTNLSNLRYRAASRAEVLFGVEVRYYDVGQARAL